MTVKLDHLAIVAENLDDGAAMISDMLGVKLSFGGKHDLMGTHNRLLSLGPDVYLEVIAIDPDAPNPKRARWFGLDDFRGPPRMANWVAAVADLPAALGSAPIGMGGMLNMERGDLSWSMAVPPSGAWPGDGVLPALIRWQRGRAQDQLPESGCKMKRLVLRHPEMDRLQAEWPALAIMDNVTTEIGPHPALDAEIVTPRGLVTLSSLTENA